MFLYRVKVEELDMGRMSALRDNLVRSEESLRDHCPIREMSVIAEDKSGKRELDIYLALDDVIQSEQLRRLIGKLHSFLKFDFKPETPAPRVTSELIHI